MTNLNRALARIDWPLLAEQKRSLIRLVLFPDTDANLGDIPAHLEGLLAFIDALQDAAEADGFPVIFLTEEG